MKFQGLFGKFAVVVVLMLLLSAAFGCSGGGSQPLNTPVDTPQEMTADLSEGHNLLGFYNLIIDTDEMTVDVLQDHSAMIHFNVAPFLLANAPHAIAVALIGFDPDERVFYLEISLKNPMFKTGYDVKGIICLDGTGEYDLRNPDVYTHLWSPEVSPFIYFAKNSPNYAFLPAATYKEPFDLYISETHSPTFDIPFAIDAHWPGIQEDCIWIKNIDVQNNGANVTIECDVIDAQENIERVWADTSAFTGGDTDFVLLSGIRYRATFPVGAAPGGLNRVLLSAKSEDTDVLLHHFADVFVEAGGAVLEGEVFNAITLQKAQGTKLFVENVIGGGFEPMPTVIGSNGLYYYAMEPGDYNIRVTTNQSVIQYDLMDTIYEVTINPDDHVVVDFGLSPEYLDDNNEQITCINGQVFYSDTGEPASFAQVSIDGGAQTGGVFQSRVTDERGHYVFWKVPCKGKLGNPIEELVITCVADGYIPAERTEVPFEWKRNTPQENFLLTPIGSDCYWEDSFEDGGLPGWTFEQIQCTQMWHIRVDAEVFNENVTKASSDGGPIVILPPGDTSNGRVWEPWDGDWTLWYGEEDDGSFIHDWGSLSPGGTSTCAHSARAISPVIDITTPNQATMTWKQIWEIEGVDPSIQFDFLRVYVRDVAGGNWFLFEHSNPLTEPVPDLGSGNAKHPQTSGGFDIPPVWQAIVHNLGDLDNPDSGTVEHMDFTHKEIQFKFEFGTVDRLYNGFRGWLVDDLCLYPIAIE